MKGVYVGYVGLKEPGKGERNCSGFVFYFLFRKFRISSTLQIWRQIACNLFRKLSSEYYRKNNSLKMSLTVFIYLFFNIGFPYRK